MTSLPGPHGNGDLGKEARSFADFLARAGQSWWQMLPIGPAGYGDSPYSAQSAFAGNPLLVDLDALGVEPPEETLPDGPVDYARAAAFRDKHLRRAFEAFQRLPKKARRGYDRFVEAEADWLDDFALFHALKRAHGEIEWTRWEKGYRLRRPDAMKRAKKELAHEIAFAKFVQFRFDEQWRVFREYCREKSIGLIGDIPIFVAHDSADVWQRRELFELDANGLPLAVAGVPPDYFSATGQRWGNPLYRWPRIAKTRYAFWVERFEKMLARFDAIRLDHFIGFVRYWRIPASEPNAVKGKWMKGPGRALFDRLRKVHGELPLVAEDLGAVTPAVTALRDALDVPGIRLLQFGFGTDPQGPTFLPHNYVARSVAYTGTHDNDTLVGWFHDPGGGPDSTRTALEADAERAHVRRYLGKTGERLDIEWEMIRLCMMSVANTTIFPMQDVLGLGSDARMNRPGNASGNWRYRLNPVHLTTALETRLLDMARTYGRAR